ncbi:hypothetical protein GobsT_51200 [Gemmata obscuriglobus]|nr:hypothetical protein GobsT_51200 [Gemmata obscuriglobus]VTS09639.1 unnamed protein product [Gemmata obscuriglobus UQM 2246]
MIKPPDGLLQWAIVIDAILFARILGFIGCATRLEWPVMLATAQAKQIRAEVDLEKIRLERLQLEKRLVTDVLIQQEKEGKRSRVMRQCINSWRVADSQRSVVELQLERASVPSRRSGVR